MRQNGGQMGSGRLSMKMHTRQAMIAYLFLLIPLVFFLGIRIFPTIYAFFMSFSVQGEDGYSFGNYVRLFHDPVFWKSVLNTFLYLIITVPLQLAFGLLIALGIERVHRFRWFYRIVFFLPYMTSIVAVSWVWRLMYDSNIGVLNQILKTLHLPQQGWLSDPDQALLSVSAMLIWQMTGFTMLIFLAGLQGIPRQYYEAAEIDGASKWKTFWKITFPLLNPTILFLTVIGAIQSLQTFTQIVNLTGGSSGTIGGPLNSTSSIVVYMYKQGFRDFNMEYASAITVVLFIMIMLITLIQLKLLNRNYDA
ncbi:sugar ABC transporter permease [Virgibacillus sp. 179-BFC.A HS]|uniref:Sugar ABC transporter permease n=1 Tax=Tigheibacillus jepli TaxID=3035914 RepID=A0ABU5CHD4_9BACI|nr:sugar ABC transporter permease [Virgibacillus sp. 179-BFC.A HS]MDY0404948.1 sugar ABC transporter permease [Virgibacillus sp. 179-BFC.A HS]